MKKLSLLFSIIILTGCQSTTNYTTQSHSLDNSHSTQMSAIDTKTEQAKKNIWRFIANECQLSIPDNHRIIEQRNYFLARPNSLTTLANRAEPYIYWITEQLLERNMPIELALVPMLESAFNPLATSPAKAAGLWQIVPITAKEYGIEKNKWFDPRRDTIASTEAALDMLQKLNSRYNGDWLLTLAAYNCGEGCVNRAIKFNKSIGLPTYYWALNLPTETMNYVPRMLALVDLISDHKNYNIALPHSNYDNALTSVELNQPIKLTQAAKMTGLSLEDIISYNAGYTKAITQPSGPHRIMLPRNCLTTFEHASRSLNFDITKVSDYRTVNNLSSYDLSLTNSKYQNITDSDLRYFHQQHLAHSQIRYKVKRGDSLYSIAKSHKVKVGDLLRWNKIKNAHLLKPGQVLTIQVKKTY